MNKGVNCIWEGKKLKKLFSKGLFRRFLLMYYCWLNKIIVVRDHWVFSLQYTCDKYSNAYFVLWVPDKLFKEKYHSFQNI